MERNEWMKMFVVGPPPNRAVFMKPEYRELVKTKLKQYYSELFPNLEILVNKDKGTLFESDKTILHFENHLQDSKYIDLEFYHWFPEKGKWMHHYEILQETGDEDDYIGDPNEEDVIAILIDVYESNKVPESLETLTLKRSEIGWSDPITMDPIRSGDQIIRINKDNRFIFQKKALERSWLGKEKKNPLTNQVVTPQQIEKFTANVTEDAGAEPMTGGRKKRRRKTLRRKNLRSSRKNK
jgi:hypothetical protein